MTTQKPGTEISIVHIDHNQLFREGLRRILGDSRYRVVGEATSSAEGIRLVTVLKPQLIIMDTRDCKGALAELMASARAVSPRPGVVVLTDKLEIPPLARALEAGVDGYLLKDMSSESLRQSLELVLTGEKVFPTALTDFLVDDQFVVSQNAKIEGRSGALSNREAEILTCLVNGHSNKTIANQLHIMEGTVKVHLKGILKKIRVRNRTQAAIWAIHNGVMGSSVGELRSIKANGARSSYRDGA